MLSVLLARADEPMPLAASLASLVPGAVEGLVREVVVVGALDERVRTVAEHAGCRIDAGADLSRLIASCKGEWLLVLEAGAQLNAGWIEAVTAHLAAAAAGRASPRAARFTPARGGRPRFLARILGGPNPLADGLLLPKAQGLGTARSAHVPADLGRGLALRRLPAEIRRRPA